MKTDRIHQRRWICVAAAAVILIIAATALVICCSKKQLILTDRDTGEVLAKFDKSELISAPDSNGAETLSFSVEFIHSVNKSPVRDYYEIRQDGIYVVKTIYYGFGAGVQTELEEGEHLSYGPDGEMIISDIHKRINPLIYVVGTVSDHILYLNDKEVSLRDLCGRNTHVIFEYR